MTEDLSFEHVLFSRLSHKEALMVDLINDKFSVVVTRTLGQKIGYYLGVYLNQVDGLSEETTGVMGNYLSED